MHNFVADDIHDLIGLATGSDMSMSAGPSAAMRGTAYATSPGASCPSDCAMGSRMIIRAGWYRLTPPHDRVMSPLRARCRKALREPMEA